MEKIGERRPVILVLSARDGKGVLDPRAPLDIPRGGFDRD